MPQGVFDAAAMLILRDSYTGGEAGFKASFQKVLAGYQDIYPDDQDFRSQLIQVVKRLADEYSERTPVNFEAILTRAIELRMELDDDMRPKSKLKKLFSGAAFSQGHPAPQVRVVQAEAHAKYLIQFIGQLPPFSR
jgi:hypothetical protein